MDVAPLELLVTVTGVSLIGAMSSAARRKETPPAASASSITTHVPSKDAASKPSHPKGMTTPSAQNIKQEETVAYENVILSCRTLRAHVYNKNNIGRQQITQVNTNLSFNQMRKAIAGCSSARTSLADLGGAGTRQLTGLIPY
jgi:hypothetical protein